MLPAMLDSAVDDTLMGQLMRAHARLIMANTHLSVSLRGSTEAATAFHRAIEECIRNCDNLATAYRALLEV